MRKRGRERCAEEEGVVTVGEKRMNKGEKSEEERKERRGERYKGEKGRKPREGD